MRALRVADRAVRFASVDHTRAKYVCHSCQLNATRSFHAAASRRAEGEVSFMQRIRDTVFGTKKSQAADESRIQKKREQIESLRTAPASRQEEVKEDAQGRKYVVASVHDPIINPAYLQASNWDQLDRVGSERWVKNQKDGGADFDGFLSMRVGMRYTEERLKLALHQMAVEIVAFRQADRDLSEICTRVGAPTLQAHDRALAARRAVLIQAPKNTKGLGVRFQTEKQQELVLRSFPNPETLRDLPYKKHIYVEGERIRNFTVGKVKYLQQYKGTRKDKDGWMQLSLRDPLVKLAVAKRLTQLIGLRGTGAAGSALNFEELFHRLKAALPKPKLLEDEDVRAMQHIPNVTVQEKETLSSRETKTGRWKMIEQELSARNLPIPGSHMNKVAP